MELPKKLPNMPKANITMFDELEHVCCDATKCKELMLYLTKLVKFKKMYKNYQQEL